MRAAFQLSQRAENEGESPGGLISCLGAESPGGYNSMENPPTPKMGATIVQEREHCNSRLAFEAKTNSLVLLVPNTLFTDEGVVITGESKGGWDGKCDPGGAGS